MDPYLESLVKQNDQNDKVIEDVVEEETNETEGVSEPAVVKDAIEEVAVEPEVTEEGIAIHEVAEVEEVADKAAEPVPEKVEIAFQEEGQTIFVRNMKIFNAPDAKGVFRIYTGNIVLGNKVSEEFTAIDYMKPGFGLVKGYIQK